MIETEKYLESINNFIEIGTKIEGIRNIILDDRLNDKISFKTYEKAIKLLESKIIESDNKKSKARIEIRYITDPKEEQEIIAMSKGKHPIEELLENEIDEK